MAPPRPEERQDEQAKQGCISGEYDAPLAEMMEGLAIQDRRSAVAMSQLWQYDAATAVNQFAPALLGPHRRGAYAPAPPTGQEGGPSAPSQMHPASARMPQPPYGCGAPDARRFAEPAVGMFPPSAIATARGAHRGGHAYMPPPPPYLHGGMVAVNRRLEDPNLFSSGNEEALLLALSHETPETIVAYACDLLESRHGQRLFQVVFDHCNQQLREWVVATITRDWRSFSSLCTRRPDEVIHIISSCETRASMQLLGDAMVQWMANNKMRYLLTDSKRIKVLQAFIVSSPPDITQFISEAVAKNCTRLACQPNGLRLLQNCLERVSQRQKDDSFTQLSYQSLFLAQSSCGNWIVQDVLQKGDPSHIGIIASCLREHYVTLARNKYGSNVVECCLRVFHEEERSVIVHEFISYPHFRDLVTDEFANFAISTALETCKHPLRNILAHAIVAKNIIERNQHCTKIFTMLAKYGFMQ